MHMVCTILGAATVFLTKDVHPRFNISSLEFAAKTYNPPYIKSPNKIAGTIFAISGFFDDVFRVNTRLGI